MSPTELVAAVVQLLELAGYEVEQHLQLHGAEIDLRAFRKQDFFRTPLIVECTVEYVDNTKYGKDLTKLMLVREKDHRATLLIVSLKGFTAEVRERAHETRIECLTYDEFRRKMVNVAAYENLVLGPSDTDVSRSAPHDRALPVPLWKELAAIEGVYEPPELIEPNGRRTLALEWFDR